MLADDDDTCNDAFVDLSDGLLTVELVDLCGVCGRRVVHAGLHVRDALVDPAATAVLAELSTKARMMINL